MKASALAARDRVLRQQRRTRRARPPAACSSTDDRGRAGPPRAAAPTAAYWSRSSCPALADQGSSSASSSSQEVPSSSNRPAASAAARSRSTSSAVRGWSKNGRPVRVHTAPSASPGAPNRARGRVEVAADERDRPRAHVLLLAHHLVDALGPVGVERLVRVLEQLRAVRGRDRAHRRRQVEQPARVDREPAHHLERGRRVLLPDADPPQVARLDDPASGHVGDVEHLGLTVSGRRPGPRSRLRPG